MRSGKFTLIVLAAIGTFLAMPRVAAAHAVLLASAPEANAVLADFPTEITLTFNESVDPIFVKVLDGSGKAAGQAGPLRVDGNNLHLPLTQTLAHGSYVVTYRVVSADTHPVASTFAFAVGQPLTESATPSPENDATGWTIVVGMNRWLLYASMLFAVGAALSGLVLDVPEAAAFANIRCGCIAAVIATASSIMSVGFSGAELLMSNPEALVTADVWRMGGGTTLLPSALLGTIAMLCVFYGLAQRIKILSGLGVLLGLGSFVVTGHAATAAPVWLMAPMVAIHLACAAFWLGAFVPLFVSARVLPPAQAGAVMTRFSIHAVIAVAALILSGLVITYVQVTTLRAFIATAYGVRLLVKLVLFGLLLALAAYNKKILTPLLLHGEASAAKRLRRTIAAELVIYILILGAAASLTLTPPPRTQQVPNVAAKVFSIASGDYSADISIVPARRGTNTMTVLVRGKDRAPAKLDNANLFLSLRAAGIDGVEKRGELTNGGAWQFVVSETFISGVWNARLRAFVTPFDSVDFAFEFVIK